MLKVIGFFVGSIVLLGAIFAGVVWFVFNNAEDQSYLTKRVAATEVQSKWNGDQYIVVYGYDVDGTTYYGEDRLYRRNWQPGDSLRVCVDPSDVAQHALANQECGSSSLGTSTQKGTTTKPSIN